MKCAICKAHGPGYKITFPDPELGEVTLCPGCMKAYVDPAIGDRAKVVKA